MVKVAATEFAKNFGEYRELAQREAVAVTIHDRVTGYFVSSVEFEEYQRLKEIQQKALDVTELPSSVIEAIASSRMDSSHNHLNALLEED